jgi:hypothetical protein
MITKRGPWDRGGKERVMGVNTIEVHCIDA